MSLKKVIAFIAYIIVGWIFCTINPHDTYSWYSGIWHGVFFLPNILKTIFWGNPYQARFVTSGYIAWYWVCAVLSVMIFIGKQHDTPKMSDESTRRAN